MLKTLTAAIAMSMAMLANAQQAAVPPAISVEHQEAIRKAVGSNSRSITNVMRDAHRNPEQTLGFFAIEPQHTVVEIWPGTGWYTEILAPLLRDDGKLIAAHFDPDSDLGYFKSMRAEYAEKLEQSGDIYDRVEMSVLDYDPARPIAEPGSADRVLTFRNVHNWLSAGEDHAAVVFAKIHQALKPGGMLGLVEHRARPGTDLETMLKTGYVTEALVIEMAEQAGLELLSRSPVNQNPQDSTDHPEGVWSLPPTLRMGDESRAHYLAIGESDRMTLLFVKPED